MASTGTPSWWKIPSKERTLLLLRLNIAGYPTCKEKFRHYHNEMPGSKGKELSCSFPKDVLEPIFQNNESIYGEYIAGGRSINSLQDENTATQKWELDNWNLLTANTSSSISSISSSNNNKTYNFIFTDRSIPQDTSKFDIGVSAIEWNIDNDHNYDNSRDDGGGTSILVFRGTYSPGDYDNIEHWMMDYILEKSTDRMKQAWVDDSGLPWTSEMQSRLHDDTIDRLEIRAFLRLKGQEFPKNLIDAISSNEALQELLLDSSGDGLTLQDEVETGYWKLTKHIVDEVYARAFSQNRTLVISGHSQGGTRAQLASMYLHHKHGVKIPTVSFAATGSACVARHLFHSKANFLSDVDPMVAHDHITEYVHPLDPWGNSMLGQDNGGQVCYYGTSYFSMTDPTFKYCSQIYGWSGPTSIANENSPLPRDIDLQNNFKRCRYFTHNPKAMFMALARLLNEDGTTEDGGCQDIPVIPLEDSNGSCPTGSLTTEEDEAIGVVVLSVLVLVVSLVCCCCCRRTFRQQRQRRRQFGLHTGYMGTLTMHENYRDDDSDGEGALDDRQAILDFDEPVVSIELPSLS